MATLIGAILFFMDTKPLSTIIIHSYSIKHHSFADHLQWQMSGLHDKIF